MPKSFTFTFLILAFVGSNGAENQSGDNNGTQNTTQVSNNTSGSNTTGSTGSTSTNNATTSGTTVPNLPVFEIDEMPNGAVNENEPYTSASPTLSGDAPIGDLIFTLKGADQTQFTVDSATGIVSMVAQNFEIPVDSNTDNNYEVTLVATDSQQNFDEESWQVDVNNLDFSINTIADFILPEGQDYTSEPPCFAAIRPRAC